MVATPKWKRRCHIHCMELQNSMNDAKCGTFAYIRTAKPQLDSTLTSYRVFCTNHEHIMSHLHSNFSFSSCLFIMFFVGNKKLCWYFVCVSAYHRNGRYSKQRKTSVHEEQRYYHLSKIWNATAPGDVCYATTYLLGK